VRVELKEILVLLKGNINYDSRVQKEISTFISLGFKVTLAVWNFEAILYNNNDIKIMDVNLSNHKLPQGAFFTFFKIIKFWYICANIIKKGNYDYIHCNDLDTLGVIYFLPKRYHKFMIYDAHELFPEQYSVNSIRYAMWNYIERQLIKKINSIITPELNRSRYIKEKYRLIKIPYAICNFPKYQIVIPKDIKKQLNIPSGKIILCYHGIISPDRMIEAIIESLRYLSSNFIVILFGFAFGNYFGVLEKLLNKFDLRNRVYFFGKVPPGEILSTIAQCDIGIALYENKGINSYYCAPNKVFDYLMTGTKIITNNYPSLQMLKKYKFVRLISQVNPKNIADCAKDLVKEKCVVPNSVKREFSWESFNQVFRKIYN